MRRRSPLSLRASSSAFSSRSEREPRELSTGAGKGAGKGGEGAQSAPRFARLSTATAASEESIGGDEGRGEIAFFFSLAGPPLPRELSALGVPLRHSRLGQRSALERRERGKAADDALDSLDENPTLSSCSSAASSLAAPRPRPGSRSRTR